MVVHYTRLTSRARSRRALALEAGRGAPPALPEGFDTVLAERGQSLSQGQRQLLAFARVLALESDVLILDEATASIDPETEAKFQAAVARAVSNRTAIVVAHRLQTRLP